MEDCTQITILMAEDDEGHARLIRRHLKEAGVDNVVRFKDGAEAWAYLSGAAQPCLVPGRRYLLLLDIRMPGMDGIEVLRRVKTEARLKKLPITMLTTTDDPKEIAHCYELGCNGYLVKPVEFGKFGETIKRLGLFTLLVSVPVIEAR